MNKFKKVCYVYENCTLLSIIFFSGYNDIHPKWSSNKHLLSPSRYQGLGYRTECGDLRTYLGNPLGCLPGKNTWQLTELEASNSSFY